MFVVNKRNLQLQRFQEMHKTITHIT